MRALALLLVAAFCHLASTAAAQDRVALVIGNGKYASIPALRTAEADAAAVSAALAQRGYRAYAAYNVTQAEMLLALARFRAAAETAGVAVIYFAGHGVDIDGETHLAMRDTARDAHGRLTHMVPVRILARAVSDRIRQKVLFIDACRAPPELLSAAASGAAPATGDMADGAAGLFVSYSAQPGGLAEDGLAAHSPFASAFLQALDAPGEDIAVFARRVRLNVVNATGGAQIPGRARRWSLL